MKRTEYYLACRFVIMTLRLRLKFRVTLLNINCHQGREGEKRGFPVVYFRVTLEAGHNKQRMSSPFLSDVLWGANKLRATPRVLSLIIRGFDSMFRRVPRPLYIEVPPSPRKPPTRLTTS